MKRLLKSFGEDLVFLMVFWPAGVAVFIPAIMLGGMILAHHADKPLESWPLPKGGDWAIVSVESERNLTVVTLADYESRPVFTWRAVIHSQTGNVARLLRNANQDNKDTKFVQMVRFQRVQKQDPVTGTYVQIVPLGASRRCIVQTQGEVN